MNPAIAARAAGMTVIRCDIGDGFHVIGGSVPHFVRLSRFAAPGKSPFYCDCQGGKFSARCAHLIAAEWFVARQEPESSRKGTG